MAPPKYHHGSLRFMIHLVQIIGGIGANYRQYSFAHWRPIIQAPIDWRQYTKLLVLTIRACERCVSSDTIFLWKESYDVMKLRDYCFPKLSGENMAHYTRYIFFNNDSNIVNVNY